MPTETIVLRFKDSDGPQDILTEVPRLRDWTHIYSIFAEEFLPRRFANPDRLNTCMALLYMR
jgi:hypothetical protein